MSKTVVVLGARNLGGAIIDHFLELGWSVAGVARSSETLASVRERGALALEADAGDPDSLRGALVRARDEYGSLDAVVNAVSAYRAPGGGAFGGGEVIDADLDAFRGWTVAVAEQAFVFLSAGAGVLKESGGGALVQFATRALVQAAAQELRAGGIHVALLAVDATIESPKTAAFTRDQPREALADMGQVARAVSYLVEQGPRAYTHELQVTPAGERWLP